MFRKLMIGAACAAALTASGLAVAQKSDFGTAAEAKAMLEKAVAAVKADKAKALDMFNKGEGGFKDRDLYPFCANAGDGVINAGPPTVRGKKVQDLKDSTGKAFGEEMFKSAAEGKISEVSYMFPRPGADTTPAQKVSFITRAGDQLCGVGYYK
jgi:hypothetical protein